MANYFITGDTLTAIANAIRSKTNTSEQILAKDFASKINALELGANLPDLTTPATAAEVFSGYQYITEEGTSATGTFTIEEEINTQDNLLSQIVSTLKTRIVNAAGLLDAEYKEDTATLKLFLAEESLVSKNTIGIYPPEALTTLSATGFRDNTLLEKINFPYLTTLETYNFSGCTKLKEVILPALTTIPAYCFSGCTSLKKVDLSNLTSGIAGMGFQNCSALEALILRNTDLTKAPTIFANIFSGSGIAAKTGYIYVPSALVNTYKTATNWSVVASQIRAIEDYPSVTR